MAIDFIPDEEEQEFGFVSDDAATSVVDVPELDDVDEDLKANIPPDYEDRIRNSLYYTRALQLNPEAAFDLEPQLNEQLFGKSTLPENPAVLFKDAFLQSMADKPALMLKGVEVYTPGQGAGIDPMLDKAATILQSLNDPERTKELREVASGKLWPTGEGRRWWQVESRFLPEVINTWSVNVADQIPLLLSTYAGRKVGKVLGTPIAAVAGVAASLFTAGPDPSDVVTGPAVVAITSEITKHLGGAAPLVAMEAGGFMDEAENLGIDRDISEKYARPYGLGSGAIEYAQQLWRLGRYNKISKVAQDSILKQVLGHIGGSLFEGVEEVSQQGLQNFLMQKAVADMKERHPDYEGEAPSLTEGLKRSGQIGAGVAFLTGLPGTGMSIAQGAETRMRESKPETKKFLGEPSTQEQAQAEAPDTPAKPSEAAPPSVAGQETVVQPAVAGEQEAGGEKQAYEMTREEFEASQPVIRKGFSSIKEGERIDALPDETVITVFHTTDSATADKFNTEGVSQADKPLNLARVRFEAGEEAEFAPGRGLASGLTVGIDPREVSGFGRQTVAIRVRKGQVRVSPEQAGLGVTSPGVALASSDAFIEGDILARDVTLIGEPGRQPKHPHEELVRAAVREGKTVPPEVLAEFPDLATPKQEAGKKAPDIVTAGGITSEKIPVKLYIGNVTRRMKKKFAKIFGKLPEDVQGFKEEGFPTKRTNIELTRGDATTYLNFIVPDLLARLEADKITTEKQLAEANADWGDIKELRAALQHTQHPRPFIVERAKKQKRAWFGSNKEINALEKEWKSLQKDLDTTVDSILEKQSLLLGKETTKGRKLEVQSEIELLKAEVDDLNARIQAREVLIAGYVGAKKTAKAQLTIKEAIAAAVDPSKLETVKMTTLEFFNKIMKGKSQAAQKAFTAAGREMVKQHKNLANFAKEELKKADATKGEINRVLNAISRARTETEQIKAMATVAAITEKGQKRAVAKRINQDVPDSVDFFYREAIELLREGIDTRFRSEKAIDSREATRKFLDRNPDLVEDMPVKLIKKLNQKPISEFTVAELTEIADAIDNLAKQGKLKRKLSLAQKARRFTERLTTMVSNITKGEPIDKSVKAKTSLTKTGLVIPKIQAARAVTLRPSRLFDKLDRGKNFVGEISEFFVRKTNTLFTAKLKATDKRTDAMRAKMEELDITVKDLSEIRVVNGERYTVDDMIDVYASEKNPLSKLAVMYGNNISEVDQDAIIAQLSAKEKAFGNAIIEEYDQNYPRVRDAVIRTENKDPGHQENYTPIRRRDVNYNTYTEEVIDAMLRRANLKKAFAERGFTKQRKENIPAEFQQEKQLGIMKTWGEQIVKQEEYIHLAQHIKEMHATRENPDFVKAVEQNFGKSYNEVIKGYVNRVANPNVYRTFGLIENTSKWLRRNTAIAYLSYNLLTAAKQVPSILLALGDVGPQHLLASVTQFISNPMKMIQEVRELDPQVKHKSIERELQELRQAGGNVVAKITKAVGDVGMADIHIMDTGVRVIVWNAVYQKALVDHSQEEAVRLAQDATLRTQPVATAKDLPQIYATSEFLNWFTMFTNQLNQIYNIATYDIPSYIKNEQYGKAALSATGMGLTALALWAISNKKLPEDKEELADVATEQFINAIPLLGKTIMAGTRGWGSSGIPAFASGEAIGRSIAAIRRGEFTDYDVKVVVEAVTVTFGVPYIGPKRVVTAIQTGDLGALLGGRQKKKTKRLTLEE